MEAYLTHRGKSDLFTDSEFHDACRRLTEMVGERDLSVLLANLYAEQLIVSKEGIPDGKSYKKLITNLLRTRLMRGNMVNVLIRATSQQIAILLTSFKL